MRTYFLGIYTTTSTKPFIPKQVGNRLEMKPHKPKKKKKKEVQNKSEKEGKNKGR
jgi:hypothetical protein